MGITQKYGINLKITGIDLSKAFDCIDRTELVNNMKLIINEGNFRILKYLLSETSLTPRIESIKGMRFETSIGTPQGDALSPVLFTVYLEIALRKYIEMRQLERSALRY